jgi:5,6-dimethylbenzimidazole synthase
VKSGKGKGVGVTQDYEMFIDLLRRRRSIRKFRPDPLPDGAIEKILEAGRWAMSGANGQPWEFIVVTDPSVKEALFNLYREQIDDYNFWLEQMRVPELRHPAFQLTGGLDEQREKLTRRPGFAHAPALIVVLGDGRRQWTTVMGGHTLGRHQSHLTDGLASACVLMHVAAAALGLGSQWVTIHIEDGFKRLLGVPDVMTLYQIIPIGYPDGPQKKTTRRRLTEIVHQDHYDPKKHMTNRQIIDYVRTMREKTMSQYIKSVKAEEE